LGIGSENFIVNYENFSRISAEETKSWISKARRRKLIKTEMSEINHAIELLPKKLNADIRSIKKARESRKRDLKAK